MSGPPQLWVFAGPNGAGKSTLVGRFHVPDRMPVVNPDTIARQLRRDRPAPQFVTLEAGRVALDQRRALVGAAQSFGMETTLTGQSELRMMAEARARGYKITVVFVGLDDALTALARVRQRVARGGHDVPPAVVLRRFDKGLAHLPLALRHADRGFLLDNSGSRPRLLVSIEAGRIRHLSRRLPDWADTVIAALRPVHRLG